MGEAESQVKSILADPVSLFTQTFPHATEDQLTGLVRLNHQYVDANKQLKDILAETRKISRQIGEAKRKKQPIEQLVLAMQERSRNVNNLQAKINCLSETIVAHFELDIKPEKTIIKPGLPPPRLHTEPASTVEQISIVQLGDAVDSWNYYVESNPAASIYHRAEWKELINKVFGHECYYIYASCEQRIVGILPLVRLKSHLFGDFMVSIPYFNYGGAIADSSLIEQKLMGAANDHAKEIGTDHIEYRDDIDRKYLPARTDKVTMILSLTDTEDVLWESFPSKLRSQIRRAQREKIRTNIGGNECLADFYSVFSHNMRDLGTPVYSKALFKNILDTFPKNCRIINVYLEDRPVAAAFLLGHADILEIPWASTIKEVNHLSINMLLYWEVLKFAIKNRYSYFDLGRSSKDSGTFRFKQQWGAIPKQLYWHYWLPNDAEIPKLNPENPRYSLAISVWKKMPIFLTNLLGPYIVRNLP